MNITAADVGKSVAFKNGTTGKIMGFYPTVTPCGHADSRYPVYIECGARRYGASISVTTTGRRNGGGRCPEGYDVEYVNGCGGDSSCVSKFIFGNSMVGYEPVVRLDYPIQRGDTVELAEGFTLPVICVTSLGAIIAADDTRYARIDASGNIQGIGGFETICTAVYAKAKIVSRF